MAMLLKWLAARREKKLLQLIRSGRVTVELEDIVYRVVERELATGRIESKRERAS